MLRYTLLRLLVFLGCVAALWLLGLRGEEDLLLLVAGAALLSAVVSYFALRRFREDYSAQLAARIDQRTAAKQSQPVRPRDEDAEDAEVSGDDGSFR
jgi:hypothetical protein